LAEEQQKAAELAEKATKDKEQLALEEAEKAKKAEADRLAEEQQAEAAKASEAEAARLAEQKRLAEEEEKKKAAAALKAASLKKAAEAKEESEAAFAGKVKKARVNQEEYDEISKKLDQAAVKLVNPTPKAAEDLEKHSVGSSEYAAALAKKYPQGVTEHVYEERGKVITERIVVLGKEGHVYRFVKHNWGGQYYFKDNVTISNIQWQKETVLD